jgi:glycosyltransferase involved in cell wall biosynthesis
MAAPLVTIAMPVFNGARFLGAAIDSILSQSVADFELILSDDGSTDESREIGLAYARKDPRIVLLASRHAGIGSAMNRALESAKGEFFAPMDQDDVAMPERVARALRYLEANRDAAVVGGAIRAVDEFGRTRKVKSPAFEPCDVAAAMHFSCAIIHPTSMMRTNLARAVGGYRVALPFALDYDLWLRLMERHEVANLPDILLLKRQHQAQVTRNHARRPAQVVAAVVAYMSYLSRQTFARDFVDDDRPLLAAAAGFVDLYLSSRDDLPASVFHHFSRFVRYAPLLTSGPRRLDHPYWLYITKTMHESDARNILRTLWYVASYFGYNRFRRGELFPDLPGFGQLVEHTRRGIKGTVA